ncbi:hypothetical protein CHCC14821_0261 [Bacillus paralicheniformis]|nr:hypothetical protein CHCC14821_0261 [Bacillus paralicheniformis]TWM64757.1 hypothetical protein CHCC14814_4422 [Bacillus paralicheniformis]
MDVLKKKRKSISKERKEELHAVNKRIDSDRTTEGLLLDCRSLKRNC